MTIHLHNKTILVTREEKAGEIFARKISQYGAKALQAPLLEITCLPYEQTVNKALQQKKYAWIFFTSKNGVDCFMKQHPPIGNCRIAAVGTKTKQAIEAYGYEVDFIPSIYHAETMAEEFLQIEKNIEPVLFVRGKIASRVLIDAFREAKRPFDCVEVYDTVTNQAAKETLTTILHTEKIDYLTFTSPSTVRAFMELTEENQSSLSIPAVCIGTTTEKSAREAGFKQTIIPNEFTIEGMLDIINEKEKGIK